MDTLRQRRQDILMREADIRFHSTAEESIGHFGSTAEVSHRFG